MSLTGVLFFECLLSSLSSCADHSRRATRLTLLITCLAMAFAPSVRILHITTYSRAPDPLLLLYGRIPGRRGEGRASWSRNSLYVQHSGRRCGQRGNLRKRYSGQKKPAEIDRLLAAESFLKLTSPAAFKRIKFQSRRKRERLGTARRSAP